MEQKPKRRPPLGPYETGPRAWIVIAAYFLLSFVEMGILKSFGVLVNELVIQFDTNTETLGFIIGLYHGTSYAFAPIISPLTKNKTLIRPLMVFGSFIMGLSLSLSSLSTNIAWFSVAMVASGVGFSIISLLTFIVFSLYFTRRFALAFGMGDMGCAVSVILPLLTEKILEHYGCRGTILILGGIAFNTIVFTALLRDPRTLPKRRAKDESYTNVREDEMGDRELVELNEDTLLPLDRSITRNERRLNGDDASFQKLSTSSGCNQVDNTRGAFKVACPPLKDCLEDFHDEALRVHLEDQQPNMAKGCYVIDFCLTPFRMIWSALDWSLCRDEPYLIYIYLATFIFGMITTSWNIFLISHAVAKGITLSQAVLLSLVSGVGDAFGRFSQGPIVHNRWMTSVGLFMFSAGLNSILFFCDPLLKGFGWLATGTVLNGIFFGTQTSLLSIMLKDYTPSPRLSTSYGLSSVAYGFSEPIGGFAAGWIASVLGYEMMFVYLGGLSVLSIITLVPAYKHYRRPPKITQGP
ncbi:monocarboxylate transporter 7-like [Lytechinus pictus]|uniref:monocarboxylate transporter 7-like n=1 Tax=Lytechinus pictus TaxID=7653 RepID=UPI0030B9B353